MTRNSRVICFESARYERMIEPVQNICIKISRGRFYVVGMCFIMLLIPLNIFSANFTMVKSEVPLQVSELPDTIPLGEPLTSPSAVEEEYFTVNGDSLRFTPVDTVAVVNAPGLQLFSDSTVVKAPNPDAVKVFTPDPIRAVWLSALCPGLGQIYNRRYWKLPIVVGGFMGLGYGASWNNGMLSDYTRAYNDFMDNDPSTNSYMNLFPPNTNEADLNKSWLERTLKSRKDYYRRNRDLCIICMVGVYLVAMVDAYVDASLSNFDITPDLSMQVAPALLQDPMNRLPALGCTLAFNF